MLCLSCFSEYDSKLGVCPTCGAAEIVEPLQPIHLTPGTLLQHGRFIIGTAIGSGGFGIVYKAFDTRLKVVVAIKEFYISSIMHRAKGLLNVIAASNKKDEVNYRKSRFLAEARVMAKFGKHKNITNVYEYFEENATAYIVMELLTGMSLSDYVKNNVGSMDVEFAKIIAKETCSALMTMHGSGIIHRDVAPDNIFICMDSEIRIKLLDLGSARLQNETDDIIDLVVKPGFSPIEQYTDGEDKIGAWSDIYALGATLYAAVTGVTPSESTNRSVNDDVTPPHELDPQIPENFSNIIMRAMAVRQHLRFKSAEELLNAIEGDKKTDSVKVIIKKRLVKRAMTIAAAASALIVGVVFGLGVFNRVKESEDLKAAQIDVWFSVADNSTEESAMESVKNDFETAFPNVTINLRGIPEESYFEELQNAALENRLPTLFESTEVSENILLSASTLDNIIDSEQFENCLFLDQYKSYYPNNKKIPLAIEVPAAFVITGGMEKIDYSEKFFSELSDFNYDNICADESCVELCTMNYGLSGWSKGSDGFFDNSANTSAVMLSSTLAVNKVRRYLTNYEKIVVYPDKDAIFCNFTYEWSMGKGTAEQTAAGEKLLSWMLGNVYQSTLMISKCNDGQIPVNKLCFESKIQQHNLEAISEIYDKFVFNK